MIGSEIVIDTSALMAICLGEPASAFCMGAIERAETLMVSAATVAEALIVARRRGVGDGMARLIDGLGVEVVPVSLADARSVADAYDRRGKSVNRAGLNFGDCFAYVLARRRDCALLFVGDDFSRTDAWPPS